MKAIQKWNLYPKRWWLCPVGVFKQKPGSHLLGIISAFRCLLSQYLFQPYLKSWKGIIEGENSLSYFEHEPWISVLQHNHSLPISVRTVISLNGTRWKFENNSIYTVPCWINYGKQICNVLIMHAHIQILQCSVLMSLKGFMPPECLAASTRSI